MYIVYLVFPVSAYVDTRFLLEIKMSIFGLFPLSSVLLMHICKEMLYLHNLIDQGVGSSNANSRMVLCLT